MNKDKSDKQLRGLNKMHAHGQSRRPAAYFATSNRPKASSSPFPAPGIALTLHIRHKRLHGFKVHAHGRGRHPVAWYHGRGQVLCQQLLILFIQRV